MEGARYALPGDVAEGPDGLLYLLNNGEGDNALYVLDQDGKVVSRYALPGTSPVSVGLTFGPDGSLYVSDMAGGQILKYSRAGGELVSAFALPSGRFNNPKGIIVAPDGSLYAAEIGNEKVYRFNSDQTLNRVYEVGCQPLYLVMSGEWMEVSCPNRLVSVNVETGLVQNVKVDNSNQIENPNGLALGPDGTLYVLQNNGVVVAYKVGH
jgi:sugar lactone lactonase YvrE